MIELRVSRSIPREAIITYGYSPDSAAAQRLQIRLLSRSYVEHDNQIACAEHQRVGVDHVQIRALIAVVAKRVTLNGCQLQGMEPPTVRNQMNY